MGQKGHSDVRPRPGRRTSVTGGGWPESGRLAHSHRLHRGGKACRGKGLDRGDPEERRIKGCPERCHSSMDECPHRAYYTLCTQALACHGSSSENTYGAWCGKCMNGKRDERIHCLN